LESLRTIVVARDLPLCPDHTIAVAIHIHKTFPHNATRVTIAIECNEEASPLLYWQPTEAEHAHLVEMLTEGRDPSTLETTQYAGVLDIPSPSQHGRLARTAAYHTAMGGFPVPYALGGLEDKTFALAGQIEISHALYNARMEHIRDRACMAKAQRTAP